jgi:hypothetical protein
LSNLPVSGHISVDVHVSGDLTSQEALIEASGRDIVAWTVPFSLNNILAWYSDRKFTIQSCEVGLFDGSATMDAVVDLSGDLPEYDARMSARNLSCSALRLYFQLAIAPDLVPEGEVSADISLSGRGSEFPSVKGVLETGACRIPKYGLLSPVQITVPIESYSGGLRIAGASAVSDDLAAIGEGVYRFDSGFEGSVILTLSDPALFGSLTGLPITGELVLGGDISSRESGGFFFGGEARLSNGALLAMAAPVVSSKFEYDGSSLKLSDISGILGTAALEGNLDIPLGGASDGGGGTFSLKGIDLKPMLPEQYAQVVSTAIGVTGEMKHESEAGSKGSLIFDVLITESAGRVGSSTVSTTGDGLSLQLTWPLDGVSPTRMLVSGGLELKPASAPVYQGRALTPYSQTIIRELTDLLSGRETANGQTPEVQIPQVTGGFSIAADLTDIFGNATGTASVSSDGFTVAGWTVSSAALSTESLDGMRWQLSMNVESLDGGSMDLEGEVDRASNPLESTMMLTAAIRDSGLNQVFDLVGLTNLSDFSGSVSGDGEISGTLSEPVIDSFQLNLSESEAFGIPLSQGGISFGYSPPMLSLSQLELEGRDGFMAFGTGAIDLASPSLASASLALRLDKLDLSLLRPVATVSGKPFPFRGIASGTMQLAADALGTKILYSADISDAVWVLDKGDMPLGNVSLDAIYRPGKPQIEVKSLTLTRVGESLELSGFVPFNVNAALENDLLDLTITSETGYTPVLPEGLIATGVSWEGGLGQLHLGVTGPLVKPVFSGDFSLAVTNIKLGELTLVDKIEGTYNVANSMVTASPEDVHASGPGWEVGLDGRVNLLAFWPLYPDRNLASRDPNSVRLVAVPLAPGPVSFSPVPGFVVDAELGEGDSAPGLRWRDGKPAIAGEMDVLGGRIDIASLPQLPSLEPDEPPSPLVFDLKAELKGELTMMNGSTFEMRFRSGSLSLTGTGTDPVLVGTIVAPEGWLDISDNHFIITEPLEMTFSSVYRFDPYVTTVATQTLRNVSIPEFYGEDLTVTARIASRLSVLLEDASYTSQPPLSREEIILALLREDVLLGMVGGSLFGESFGAPGFQDVRFENVLLPLASEYLSRYIRQKAGLTDFELSLDREQRVRVYIESEVVDDLVMYYRQTFSPDSIDSYLFGARYRWRPRSWVGVELDSDENITPQVEYIIPLD